MTSPPIVTIDPESDVPAYRQIVQGIRRLLVDGVLEPGGRLPTVRQLAVDLGVHFNTVAQAYRVLADEGWLELRRRRGAVVVDRKRPAAPDKERQDYSLRRLRELTAEFRAEGMPVRQIALQLRRLADVIEGAS